MLLVVAPFVLLVVLLFAALAAIVTLLLAVPLTASPATRRLPTAAGRACWPGSYLTLPPPGATPTW